MKLFEFFNPVITEGLSSVIYHATSFRQADQLLDSNYMKGNDGISFTRSLQGSYHKHNKLILE